MIVGLLYSNKMTNKTELCKCGHTKYEHINKLMNILSYCRHSYTKDEFKNCPCKKFSPQKKQEEIRE